MRLGLSDEDFEQAMELQNVHGEQLSEYMEDYERLLSEAGEHLEQPEHLEEKIYELEREYEKNTRYA